MSKLPLGRLEKIELRDAWESEDRHFTPWLAQQENIALLSDAIGIDLEVEAQEKDVGPFRADILCKDTATGHWVLIENQLERTDHTHLGQLITYAAGLQAVTIVWIAQRFTDEHRAALDWLNGITAEEIMFFGLEVELWRIGDSPVAPKFNIVSSPNDWTKAAVPQPLVTPAKQLQLDFWIAFRDFVKAGVASFKTTQPLPQNRMTVTMLRTGCRLNAIASLWDSTSENYGKHELRAELDLYDSNAKTYYSQLLTAKSQIESERGENLTWYDPENWRTCRIYAKTAVDLNDRSRWGEYHAWLQKELDAMTKVFRDRVNSLTANNNDDGIQP